MSIVFIASIDFARSTSNTCCRCLVLPKEAAKLLIKGTHKGHPYNKSFLDPATPVQEVGDMY